MSKIDFFSSSISLMALEYTRSLVYVGFNWNLLGGWWMREQEDYYGEVSLFFFYCMARQHPAQNASTQRLGQPALTDIWEKFWLVGHSVTTGHSVAWGTGSMWHSVTRHSVAEELGRLLLGSSTFSMTQLHPTPPGLCPVAHTSPPPATLTHRSPSSLPSSPGCRFTYYRPTKSQELSVRLILESLGLGDGVLRWVLACFTIEKNLRNPPTTCVYDHPVFSNHHPPT